MMKFIVAANVALIAVLSIANASAQVSTHTLDNGLKVIVKEDHRAPVVTSQVWYKVGSAQEYGGITGVSHILEHMMFKGTPSYPAGQFSEILARVGARDNAFTGRDYTAYFQVMAVAHLETSFQLESDRMAHLTLDAAEFAKEIEVVKEERRLRTEDNPNALTYEQFMATAFNSSAYHNPIVGWMNDLDNMQVEDLALWYQRYYSPNNATLVVVGDVDPQQVFSMAERYYGQLPARQVNYHKPRVEAPQVGQRHVEIKAVAKLPYLLMGYKVPVLNTIEESSEAYALAVLAGILDGGRSARLSKHLVRGEEIAASAGAGYSLYAAQDSLFLFDGTPRSGTSVEQLQAAIEAQIDTLKNEPVSAAELQRVKAQVVASETYQLDSVQRQAYVLGSLETVGLGWQEMQNYSDEINKIDAQAVMAVARKYLIEDRQTIAILTPVSGQSEMAKNEH
jgi:zinc protease|tara:strand:- start:30835 stop:32187 length:1353 start_codon:yes stop_codon:yes gene_type:complete